MNKLAHYLQEHLRGEVIVSDSVRQRYARDASIFEQMPSLVAYPMDESDIRKAARFAWQLAERGRIISITTRGGGSDFSGGAIGQGIMLVTPVHMNKILEFDSKSGFVVVEPGINYAKLQQMLHTHGRFLPAYPASLEYSTIGGAVANNSSGELSVKYGDTKNFVNSLRIVLANGEVIDTGRLSKRELSKKMGLSSFEGELYRNLDTLIEENHDLITKFEPTWTKNVCGYDIFSVKKKDGSFDLTPLIVGSQGTLAIVSEVTMTSADYNPETTVIAAYLHDFGNIEKIIQQVLKIKPSAFEVVDKYSLEQVVKTSPNFLKGSLPSRMPELILLIEFDDPTKQQTKNVKKTLKILEGLQIDYRVETEESERQNLWKLRHSVGSIHLHNDSQTAPLPIVDDGVVAIDKLEQYFTGVYQILEKYNLKIAVWGHIGQGNLHMQPLLDIGQLGDRQKVFRLMREYHDLVLSLGGSISGEYNDGRLRGPYIKQQFGDEIYELFMKVKAVFDPYFILNPKVKIDVTGDDVLPLLRSEYSLDQHIPRS
ncbi:hypothetical protein A3F37_00115 [Candidatus Saccharibacteria bacterium RIFCSPHIGHO2_12_FULL_41_12]|nr:MAG: hypothetical protein A3F37_00115 [Candidatus Saccharibacteria bacterium RIFCSPHIGHO2_12_FULL_41_12]